MCVKFDDYRFVQELSSPEAANKAIGSGWALLFVGQQSEKRDITGEYIQKTVYVVGKK